MSIFNRLFAPIIGLFIAQTSHSNVIADPTLSGRKSLLNPSAGGSFSSGGFNFYEINLAHRRNHRRGIYNRRG
jgi:hypothetical protein